MFLAHGWCCQSWHSCQTCVAGCKCFVVVGNVKPGKHGTFFIPKKIKMMRKSSVQSVPKCNEIGSDGFTHLQLKLVINVISLPGSKGPTPLRVMTD